MKTHPFQLLTLALFTVSFVGAQPVDDTQLKQVIIFGRHGVRSPILPNSTLNNFSVQPFPVFSVSDVNLTPNGAMVGAELLDDAASFMSRMD